MEVETIVPCTLSEQDFANHGCWYARQAIGQQGMICIQPCVKRLVAENEELKRQLAEAQRKLNEIRNEV